MTNRNRQITRLWILFAKVAVLLTLLILAWRMARSEWLWVFLNAIWQRELG